MEIGIYYSAITDAWKFFKKYAERLPISDSEWQQVIGEASEITKQYDSCMAFAAKELVNKVNELERLNDEIKRKAC